jgi:hypothetical protein
LNKAQFFSVRLAPEGGLQMPLLGLIRAKNTQADRRASPRRRVNWGSFVALLDGSHWIKCETRDISAGGARVALDDPRGLPPVIWFLDMRNRLAYEGRIAWQRAPEIGLEFRKVHRFADAPSDALRRVIETVSQ